MSAISRLRALLDEAEAENATLVAARDEAQRAEAEISVALDAERAASREREASLVDANARLFSQVEELSASLAKMQLQVRLLRGECLRKTRAFTIVHPAHTSPAPPFFRRAGRRFDARSEFRSRLALIRTRVAPCAPFRAVRFCRCRRQRGRDPRISRCSSRARERRSRCCNAYVADDDRERR